MTHPRKCSPVCPLGQQHLELPSGDLTFSKDLFLFLDLFGVDCHHPNSKKNQPFKRFKDSVPQSPNQRLLKILPLLMIFHHAKFILPTSSNEAKATNVLVHPFSRVCDACPPQSSHTTGGLSSILSFKPMKKVM